MAAAAVVLAAIGTAAGQDRTGRRVYEEQLRVRLDEQSPEAREIGLDAGGWFTFALFKYDDASAGRFRTLRQYEMRAYANLNVQGIHRFYVRGVAGYEDWNSGDDPDAHGDDFVDPDVERAWYQFDLGRLIQQQTQQTPPVAIRVKVGREFATIGTALVLAMPLDMVQIDLRAGDWQVMGLLGMTVRDSPNIDDSERVADHQDRCFWGVQVTYLGFDDHRPFAYFLSNTDSTKPSPRDAAQAYEYTSCYVGLGSEGTLGLPDLRYQAEVVAEFGKTFSSGVTAGRDPICAMAIDVLLEYLFRVPTRPKVAVEYLFGSGDEDRLLSATATAGGNLPGTRDHAFNAFGFRDTGLAFSPRLSNLHVYAVGASFHPLEKHKLFRKMEVGTKALFYHKASRSGALSDTMAVNEARWVGWEWDVYCDWRITSDLAWTIRYGAFQPGPAFEDRTCRQFLYTAMMFSF